ncbi:MAG: lactate racemase domain-containing protein [Anaerolineae bacterium]|nr:lactate racemase domain-containing protein [Anaerolineae bacterium]
MVTGKGYTDRTLTDAEARTILADALAAQLLDGQRVLLIVPDGTRSGPIDLMFRLLHDLLAERVAALDVLIALGTHQPMSDEAIQRRLGTTAEEMAGRYAAVRVFNHHWEDPATFRTLGVIPSAEIEHLSRGLLSMDVPVTVNKLVFDYDQLIVCGPVFPHEVVGFSGGNKYFFPGISGPEVINFTHWLGALITSYEIIGAGYTPVRAVIDRAAAMIDVPKLCVSPVVKGHDLAGLYVGTPQESWEAASALSAQVHVIYVEKPFRQVLSVMPTMYDDIWTAAKGMYKLEPVVADSGEVIIYAPHIDEISYTHGAIIDEVGYHVRDYFVKQWDRFGRYPWGVLAHSTHLRGIGEYDATTAIERPRIQVTLATGIPRERCELVNLGYRDPATIDPAQFTDREDEGVLLVPHAGEMLYRLRGSVNGNQ